MRVVYPIKHYRDAGFVERKIEIHEEDLPAIIGEYLQNHEDFHFDEIEIVNKRPMNVWLHVKCRTLIDTEASPEEQEDEAADLEAEVQVKGKYDGNNHP